MQIHSTAVSPLHLEPLPTSQNQQRHVEQYRFTLPLLLAFLVGLAGYLLATPQPVLAADQIQTGRTPTTAFLQLGDQILLEQPGFHLSKPQRSPDGRWLAVTVTPSGAGTAFLAEIYIFDTNNGAQLARFQGYLPLWSSDSQQLTFENAEGIGGYDLATQRFQQLVFASRSREDALELTASQQPLAYPTTIRVAHHPSNGCRDVADGQVDVIPFDTYVAQVVPAEVPASWPAAALEAMAVAARTYAWRQILVGRPDYDVTDWANFQMMCPDRYPSTDAAAAATAGQYLTAKQEQTGLPISAMYSAENGHPTLTNPNVTYLQAVPDLPALGRVRNGHGYGLSQWGAYRRALAGQNYRQILGHYYSAVYLQNGLDPTKPAVGLLGFLPPSTLSTNSLYLATIGPADFATRLVITASAGLTTPVNFLNPEAIWRAPQPLADQTSVTAQVWLQDQLQDQVTLLVDQTAPTAPTWQGANVITQPVATLLFPLITDTTPLLKTPWRWQGEELLHTANSGALINDAQASDGTAWGAQRGIQQKGVWYGPRTTQLPPGYSYRALFWLRAGAGLTNTVAAQTVARLDVTDDEGKVILGLRDLRTSDFATTDRYWPIAVDFYLFDAPRGLEFRVAWPGVVDLALDRVEIWRLPSSSKTNREFRLPFYGQMGELMVEAAQMDSAGNLSQAATRTVNLVDSEAPQIGPWPLPTTWLNHNAITVSLPITDSFSGLASGRLLLAGPAYSLTVPAQLPGSKLSWQGQLLSSKITGAPDGDYVLTIEATDRAGNVRSQSNPLRIDTRPPTVTAQISGTAVNGWYGAPVQLTLAANDQASGVAHIAYKVAEPQAISSTIIYSYTQPISLTSDGLQQVDYWAIDHASNVAATQQLTVALDLAAPVVRLQQVTFITETVRITWQMSDAGAGVALVEMQIQQGEDEWQPAPWDYTTLTSTELTFDPDQPTKVRARAQDRFGRLSDWTTITLWRASAWLYLPVIRR
ncbi:MAG: OmpL47-type beta-barrel domain-containing protein [Caldilineaceae bacterium]